MTNDDLTKVVQDLVELAVLNANETSSLINSGDDLDVANFGPGSLARANNLRGVAAALKKTLDQIIEKP